eukprot:Colp12_sorted_trinity150504_noHs@29739
MSASRLLTTFPFSPTIRTKLLKAGFKTAGDVLEVGPITLSQEIGVSREEAVEAIQILRTGEAEHNELEKAPTALALLGQLEASVAITTACAELDHMLGGGVPLRKLTELCGAPGVGKTQIGIQLAVNVQIPRECGGVEGHAVYIDSEGSFMAERAADMAAAMARHLRAVHGVRASSVTCEGLLKHIHCFRVHHCTEQLAVLYVLEDFLREHSKVRLIVVDSIAFHFRHDFSNMMLRTRLLAQCALQLLRLAATYNCAVVLTNQMTTKLDGPANRSRLVPALGESWGHASTNRVLLYWNQGRRCATLFKSPNLQASTVEYAVELEGVRSVSDGHADAGYTDGYYEDEGGSSTRGSKRPLEDQHNDGPPQRLLRT